MDNFVLCFSKKYYYLVSPLIRTMNLPRREKRVVVDSILGLTLPKATENDQEILLFSFGNLPWVLHSHNHPNPRGPFRSLSAQFIWVYLSRPGQHVVPEQFLPTSHRTTASATELHPCSQISEHERGLILASTALSYCWVTLVRPLTFPGLIYLDVKWVSEARIRKHR